MFQLVLGYEGFGQRIKTADNGGGDGVADPSPGKDLSGARLKLPAKLLKDAMGVKDPLN